MSTRRPTAPRHQPSTDGSSTLRESFSGTLLVSLAALAAVAPLATDTYLPAFTQMAQDLRVSASSVQLTMTAFLIGVAVGQLVIGVLSDRFGRRPLLVWGTALAFVAGVGTAIAPGIGVLLVARLLQGLGGAAGMVLGRAVISDRSRGITATQALSLVMSIQGVAPVLAPILGGALVGAIGWRGVLGVVAGFTGVLLLMVLAWVPETLPEEKRFSGGFGVLADGTRFLCADRVFVRLVAINAVLYATLMAYLSAAPFVLKSVLGMSVSAYTVVFAVCGLTVTVVVAIAGSQARRVSPARQVRVGLLCQLVVDVALGAVAIALLRRPVSSTALLAVVVALLVLHVACLGMSVGNLPALALDRTGRWAGTGSALLGFIQFAAGGLASPLVGLSGETSGLAFGITLIVLVVLANLMALAGLRGPGEKERLRAEREAAGRRRLGRDQVEG
ncbi:multidrug effflux MFS transporter [Actinomyces haliotis]|uniref:multidrug effflux MFS transporter n=1 Tax=Actinomyces haliotis TaxID=1280843 RepID=UPI00188F4C10|nr:multidrug effflux MFS transporter [Actinomyces haliotis]